MSVPFPMPHLPEWGTEDGLSQVSCSCGNDTFYFLLSTLHARMICAKCKAVVGTLSRLPSN